LVREGIDRFLDLVVSQDDVTHAKPHPEAVEKALRILYPAGGREAMSRRAVMVGDSSRDIEMGKNAGIATVLYFPDRNRRYYDPAWLESCGPDYIVHDLNELEEILL
jgi:pyrophosphatase PpaX